MLALESKTLIFSYLLLSMLLLGVPFAMLSFSVASRQQNRNIEQGPLIVQFISSLVMMSAYTFRRK